jgi:molybdenum cofactor cytidylyltransferase
MKVAILLAAGSSRRMGRPKLDLVVEGRPMSRLAAEALLAAPFERIRVVTAPGPRLDLPEDARVEVVVNSDAGEGIGSSIRKGLEGLSDETEVAAIALADLPLVLVDTLSRLCRAWDESRSPVVYPEYRGRQGHPVLWARPLFDELRSLQGDRGARDVLERHRRLALALAVPVDDAGVCLDIDTPDDYAKVAGAPPRGPDASEP